MQPDQEPIEQLEGPMKQTEGIDLLTAYRTVLRVLAQLESEEYTSDCERQDAVWGHNALPAPASENGTRQG